MQRTTIVRINHGNFAVIVDDGKIAVHHHSGGMEMTLAEFTQLREAVQAATTDDPNQRSA